MWRKWLVAVVLAGVLAGVGAAQAKFLTNDDIVAMVKAGQTDDAVLTAIQGNGTDFDVSAKAVLLLKKSGVSKKVIDAMIGAVKEQKDAAAAVISSAQEKIAAQDAEDKAEQAKVDSARMQRAAAATAAAAPAMPGAMGMPGVVAMPATMGPVPGMPSVSMVQNGQKQPLGLAHTQIVPTNMPLNANQMQASSMGSSMNGSGAPMNGLSGLSNDATLGSNLGSLAKMLASSGGIPGIGGGMGGLPIGGLPGAGAGKGTAALASTLMMANPMITGAVIAGSLLKHKAQASQAAAGAVPGQGGAATQGMGMGMMPGQPGAAAGIGQGGMTAVWAIPGAKSETVVHGGQLTFDVQLDGTAGVNPDDYEPVLIRLTPTQSNFRLVGATTMNPNQIQSTEANWNLYASFVEQRLPAQATKLSAGRYTLLTTGIGLPAGEYGVVLRPINKDKKFAGNNVGQNVGDGLVFNCVWTFEVQ